MNCCGVRACNIAECRHSLVYFAEKETGEIGWLNCTGLTAVHSSHPCYSWTFIEAFWWGLMTITTVGYDLQPKLSCKDSLIYSMNIHHFVCRPCWGN